MRYFVFVLFLAFAVSCGKEEDDRLPFEPEYLVSYESMKSYSKQDILSVLEETQMALPVIQMFVQNDVNAIRITYHTVDVDGQPVVASGALLVPATNAAYPMLSFQHGTIYDPSEAPSVPGSYYTDLGAFLSSTGFITVLPDYLGYGASAHISHPYQHRQSLATATRDMIRASYEYFQVVGLTKPSDKLFLSGYSQGGYATMATLKLIQEAHHDEFNVRAATVGAGPYNKTASVKYLLGLDEEHENINTFIWVLDVYNKSFASLQRPYSYYYNEPWAGIIEQEGVFAVVDNNPATLFTEAFKMGILQETDAEMLAVFAENDIFSWRPEVPLQLYHGTGDKLVPFLNSQTAYDAMTAIGAKGIELKPIEGATHLSAFWDYMIGTFTFFLPLLAS